MDNTITALQNLYVALGGDAADVADVTIIPDMINAIAQIAKSGGANLPPVSAADNGKALVVKNGDWGVDSALPAVTVADNGMMLMVADGKWAVGNPT